MKTEPKKTITILMPDGEPFDPAAPVELAAPAVAVTPAPDYDAFLAAKSLRAPSAGITDPPSLNPALFPFQGDIVRWALKRGRAAVWADCGLGKSWMALEWARIVSEYTGLPVLILTPLAVARQFVEEGAKMGIGVTHAREAADLAPGVNVTNYERLHKFAEALLGGVVCDESSILKDYTASTRNALIERFAATPFRLACTATPAPNDFMELGNHAEFLGVMSRTEMLSMFFVHDGGSTQDWRLKGHARRDFWRWVSSWAVALRSPADLGYPDEGFRLPPLTVSDHVVSVGAGFARTQGSLFVVEARGLSEQREARKASLADRVRLAAEIVAREPEQQWLIFCDLNDESKDLAAAIPGAVEVTGSDSEEDKEARLIGFVHGDVRVLVSKPSIAGWGLNMQGCARVMFVGLSHSFEAWYQAVRRVYRFGQKRPVDCHMITSDAEGAVAANLRRKQADAEHMVASIVAEVQSLNAIGATKRDVVDYAPTVPMEIPEWIGKEDAA